VIKLNYTGTINNINLDYKTKKPIVSLLLNCETGIDELRDKKLSIELKQFRNKRSLDANAYLWALLQKMADKLNTSKDELYIEILSRYGVFTHMVVKENVVDRVMQEWKVCKNLGQVTVNGQTGIQLQCYFGSSGYDSKEMSVLINGVVSECKDLDIDTVSPNELNKMLGEWNKC
jgi:hypothetical protein